MKTDNTSPHGRAAPKQRAELWKEATDLSVLIIDHTSVLADLYELWLPDEYSIQKATTKDEALSNLDHSVAVALLCENFPNDTIQTVQEAILEYYPHCQNIIVQERSTSFSKRAENSDEYLVEPVDREELRESVRTNLHIGVYGAAIHQYLHVSSSLAAREFSHPEEKLGEDDVQTSLREALKQIGSRLKEITRQMEADNHAAWKQAFDTRKRFFNRATVDESAGEADKYHPDKCPECKLPWGVEHGPNLGHGYTSLGAHVLRCNDCGYVMRNPDPSDRRVARR